MKNSKVFMFSVFALLCVVFLFSGCTKKDAENKNVKKIGILQLVEHDALDASYRGFVDGLAEAGYVEGENIKIDFQNASGEVSNCQQICDIFSNSGVDLALAIATPAAQAAVNVFQETDVPVLFTAVTDAVGAGPQTRLRWRPRPQYGRYGSLLAAALHYGRG